MTETDEVLARRLTLLRSALAAAICLDTMRRRARMLVVSLVVVAFASCFSSDSRSVRASFRRDRTETTEPVMSCAACVRFRTLPIADRRSSARCRRRSGTRSSNVPPSPEVICDEAT